MASFSQFLGLFDLTTIGSCLDQQQRFVAGMESSGEDQLGRCQVVNARCRELPTPQDIDQSVTRCRRSSDDHREGPGAGSVTPRRLHRPAGHLQRQPAGHGGPRVGLAGQEEITAEQVDQLGGNR